MELDDLFDQYRELTKKLSASVAELEVMLNDHDVKLFGGQVLYKVHSMARCYGRPCAIHNPSAHHMNRWHQHFSRETGLMYRICPHKNYHVDPDNYRERGGHRSHDCRDDWWTEADDYCCIDPRKLTIIDLSDIVSCMSNPDKGY